jgi:branched-chain amino acid transport system permease protein
MTQFLQATVNGVATGAIYALLALGFVIIYKSTQVLSFAQAGLMLLGAFWVVYFSTVLELNFWLALLLGVLLAAAIGIVIERSMLRPMIGKPAFAVAILTIGLDIVLRIISTDLMGLNIRSVGDPWGIGTLTFGDLTIPTKNMYTIVITALIVAALLAFFRYSRFGLAMRATAIDQEVSLSMGVSVAGVFATSWAIAAGLAAVAGMFLSAGTGLSPTLYPRAIRALPAVVIGGLDSIPGALAGSMIIGLAEAYTVAYQADYFGFLGDNFAQVVAYVVMFAVLLVRPYGLFGTVEVERV